MLRYLFYFAALADVVFGIAFLAFPRDVVSAYGGTLNDNGVVVARYFAATLLALAYICWTAADAAASGLKLALVRASAAGELIGGVVAVLAVSAGAMNVAGGAVNVALAVITVVGFGYYGFINTAQVTDRERVAAPAR